MLRPKVTATREVVCLDGIWNFSLVLDSSVEEWSKVLPAGTQIPVPASYNDILLGQGIREHVGWVKYQRLVRVPRGWSPDHYFIRCDAATHRGRIYVNDDLVADHQGGYTPFEADITKLVKAGEEFRLTIAVCNELSNETIPPGSIEVLANGKRQQRYLHDFFNYSGLSRSVWLHSVPAQYVQDITVITEVAGKGSLGIVNYETKTHMDTETQVRVTVADEMGVVAGRATGPCGTVNIESVRLWQPGDAYLYKLTISLHQPDEVVVDEYHINVGVRTVNVQGSQFLINNTPFYFTGFGKHEDTPIRGKGHDPAYMVHDFQLLDWIGANSFRTSHYPYAEEVYEFADRHGIVVIDETAAVGLNLGIASGLFGKKAPPTWSPETMNENTRASHAQNIHELISRDKNHASVVMWCIANEPASHEQGAREYFAPLVDLTRSLDPTRPVCFTNFVMATSEQDLISDLFDVLCLNRYYGWYEYTGDMEMAEQELETDLRSWQIKYGKPMIMAEYGSDTIAGLHMTNPGPWSEEFQNHMLESYHRVFDRLECVVGEQVWSFSDFQTSAMVFRVDGNKKGVFTRDRRPKLAAQTLRKRWLERKNA
ncbi:beta-glucuronidase [Exophiala aquamarina CBS 119918]|uniref:Beta-glucuronidase n=1 Tax=Exophiala aquamarina CBS 119918 TaxID=1182545 RepID=A0A072P3H7_9EURO|nr:beta-glucuronidase [Exophiala aquamarina CBS 119918]KEF53798.1 beta-glucuronidase [Exophiala aquamarina CBS 119918]